MEMKPVFIEIATDLWPAPPVCYVTLSVISETESESVEVIYTDRPSLHKHRLSFSNHFNSGGDCVVRNQQITGPHYSCPSCPKFTITHVLKYLIIFNTTLFTLNIHLPSHTHALPMRTFIAVYVPRFWMLIVSMYTAVISVLFSFYTDVKCASLSLTNYPCLEVSNHLEHHPFHPQHTLTLSYVPTLIRSLADTDTDTDTKDLYRGCGVCSNDLETDGGYVYGCDECTFRMDLPIEIQGGSLYACLQCRALLHKSCAHLPQKMEHPLHPSHPLVLLYGCDLFTCQVCSGTIQGFWYYCSECKFYMDVRCAALKTTENNKCYKLFADLPQVIDHLLHPEHTLSFRFGAGLSNLLESLEKLQCGACLRYSRGFFFECKGCRWYIDIGCALAKYTPMMSKIHPHPLIFFDKANNLFECNSCGQCCYTPFFRCFRCDFNLHVHCVSILPRTLKSNNHVHPLTLTLTDSPIKDHADEDDNAEFYCGACEELRVLADPSYYCEECTYVAHSHCIVSKNISILEEECSKGASDTSGSECLQEECSGQESNVSGTEEEECSGQDSNASESEYVEEPQSLTLKEFLDSFDRIEKNHVESLSQYYDVIKHYCRSGFSRLDKIIELTIRNYELANQIEVPWQDWDESTLKVVPVGEYMIPDHWAPILRALIAKYGDIGCNSRWTSKMKMLCMMVVCIAIEDMCCTKVEDVTADLLLRWFCSLRIGLEAKFEIHFAFERLTRVACAHLGFEVNLPKAYEIRELEMKLETKRELLSLGQDCCLDAVKLKGQTAGMGLL
ncbi:hypothetical protein Acr_00g0053780 [Actinidia rufa]|uniref:DC1 domain-containing protein n=1 Tax=Actinidia rufa TaxID=165716 RepID=A0A7J0DM21_9ERIC|nr:hypothetical protein Acr_00g0053780 [Actinidia rufa]